MKREWPVFTTPKYTLGAVLNSFACGVAFLSILLGIKIGDMQTMVVGLIVLGVCGYYVVREVK